MGNATCAAVQELVPLIGSAPVGTALRTRWLDRLFEAIQEDDPPYIEYPTALDIACCSAGLRAK